MTLSISMSCITKFLLALPFFIMSMSPFAGNADTHLGFALSSSTLPFAAASDLVNRINLRSNAKVLLNRQAWKDHDALQAIKEKHISFASVTLEDLVDFHGSPSYSWLVPETLATLSDSGLNQYKTDWHSTVSGHENDPDVQILFLAPEVPTYRLLCEMQGDGTSAVNQLPRLPEAVGNLWSEAEARNLIEFHHTRPSESRIPFHAVIANRSAWDGLDDDVQSIVLEELGELESQLWQTLRSDAQTIQRIIEQEMPCTLFMPGTRRPGDPSPKTPLDPSPKTPVARGHTHTHAHFGLSPDHKHPHVDPHHL